jgi:tape measure domain-containing protein
MAAELRLGVSFDLVYFRQQLGKLSQIAASEFAGKVKLNIDKRDFQRQLTSLTKELRINVNDSQITGAREKLGQLNRGIATLRRAVAAPIEIKIKYTEQGKPPVGFGGTAARAVSGRVAGTQIAEGASRAELQKIYGLFREANLRIGQLSNGLGRATADELRGAIVPAFSDSGEEAINGLANGLKDGSSKVGKAAARIGEGTLRAIKDVLGIASPSREFRKIGQFSIDGLEAGFVDGLQGFKTKAVSEIKKIVALLKLELASVGSVNVGAGVAEARGRAIGGRRFPLRSGRQYMAPIGPLPLGSREPWSPGSRGMYGGSGFEPYMSTGGMARASVQGMPGIRSALTSASMVGVGRLALPPAGGSGGSREAALALRELEARARSAARAAAVFAEDAVQASRRRGLEVASGQVPLGGGGRFLPPGGGGGGGGGNQGRGVPFGFSMQGMPSSLPGQGLIREMGDEFGFAAKQVLLFGAAYKALAAVTNFPAQVTEAVSALQNFRNTLTAVTPSSEEFRASSDLILGLVEKYNIPLQSARDGFTRLYASMQPAGFGGEEIRELFTGISKAAATFGMSADKVDRVNYAFAQMASKGQVMSEELKGQLGDVLPGAMAIFAEAAGFEGPNAISEFSQALEDGAYKGEAMKALLTNVGTIMNKEFGPGAEGAARTFQGAMNRMQNSMKLLHETFEPVAVGFLNTVVTPFSNGIKTLTDGLNSFFTGAAAKTSGGFAIATELEKLRPTFDGIQKNAAQVGKQLLELAKVALEVGKVFLQIAGNPIVGYLARLYLIFLPLNTVLTIARGLWASNAIQLAIFQRTNCYRHEHIDCIQGHDGRHGRHCQNHWCRHSDCRRCP